MSESGFPGAHIAIVDPKTGRSTNAFWRLLELLWQRTGGFSDILDELAQKDADLFALINSLEVNTQNNARAGMITRRKLEGSEDIDAAFQEIGAIRGIVQSRVPLNDEIDYGERVEEVLRLVIGNQPDEEDFSITIEDEGTSLTSRAKVINFAGAGVTATANGSEVTVTISGGTGGGGAVDSVFGRTGAVVAVSGDYDADQVDYDNASSGLTATDTQGAIDEIAGASGGGAWEAIETVTVTTAGSIDVAFPAGYDAYQIVLDTHLNTNNESLLARITDDAFVSVEQGASDYRFWWALERSASNAYAEFTFADDAQDFIRLMSGTGNQSDEFQFLRIFVYSPRNSARRTLMTWDGVVEDQGNLLNKLRGFGAYQTVSAVNGIRFFPGAGNMDATARVFGLSTPS